MRTGIRDTGIEVIGEAPWGTHFCQFYEGPGDLLDILVPYFQAGLRDNEFCMWITSEPLDAKKAESVLRAAMPDLDLYLDRGQLEILPYSEWYTKDGAFDSQRVLDGWLEKLSGALSIGFEGLRLSGNTFWLEKSDWDDFTDYEARINNVIGEYPMMALCTYNLDRCSAHEIIDVMKNHQFALISRQGRWQIIQTQEHKGLSGALHESEARLRLAVGVAELGVFEWDVVSDRTVWENERMYEIFGHTLRDGTLDKRQIVDEVIHPEDAASFESALAAGMVPGRMFHHICRIRRKNDGRWRWVEFAGRFDLAPDASPLRLVGVVGDITERREAEERIRRQNAVLDGINRVFHEALTCQTDEALGTTCLEVAQAVTGSSFGFIGELNARGELDDIAISDSGWDACRMESPAGRRKLPSSLKTRGIHRRVLEHGRGFYTNDPSSDPDSIGLPEGHPPLRAFLGAPLTYGGRTIGMVAVANRDGGYRDDDLEALGALAPAIVEAFMRRRAEAERERLLVAEQEARARADAAVKVRDEFMSVAAHELKTPVTSLRGFSQLLVRHHRKTGSLNPEQIALAAARIDEQSRRLTRLTEQLLDMSRIEAGRLVLFCQETDVSELVETVVDLVRQAHPSRDFLVTKDPGIVANLDELRMEQVLVNLLDNAAKFSPRAAPIEVQVGMDGTGEVVMSVRDRGPGIPSEERGRIFERFFQANPGRHGGGMGIGLYVSHQIVELHGGSITVEEPEDGGSRFIIRLQLSPENAPSMGRDMEPYESPQSEPAVTSSTDVPYTSLR